MLRLKFGRATNELGMTMSNFEYSVMKTDIKGSILIRLLKAEIIHKAFKHPSTT